MLNRYRNGSAQSGISLVEVLVAIFLLMVGLMGVMGVQVFAQRQATTSAQRSVIVQATSTIIERMRANLDGAMCGAYNTPKVLHSKCAAGAAYDVRATADLAEFNAALALKIPNVATVITGGANGVLALAVRWNEREATATDPACPNGSPTTLRCFNTTFIP